MTEQEFNQYGDSLPSQQKCMKFSNAKSACGKSYVSKKVFFSL